MRVKDRLRSARLRYRLFQIRRRNRRLPLAEVFRRVYDENSWGGRKGEFCSGSGSVESVAAAYGHAVRAFIREHGIRTVVDVGCGDFVVGRQLQVDGVRYVGVDVVPGLIRHNQDRFGSETIAFQCLDAVLQDPPQGDLCLVRQVLQHLSNDEIGSILRRLTRYPYVMITEHYPPPEIEVVPNLDKPHGGDTRIYDDSAVYLDRAPFSAGQLELFLDLEAPVPLVRPGERFRTFLIRHAQNHTD
jgi:SAM-dependent methyltransferase